MTNPTDVRVFDCLGRAYFRRRYTILFYTLVMTVVAAPVLGAFGFSGAAIEGLLGANLLVAIVPVQAGRMRTTLLIVLAILWLARPLMHFLDQPAVSAMTLGSWTLVGLTAAGVALRYAMHAKQVDGEHLCAALSAYFLSGIYFGLLYWVIEQLHPRSFVVVDGFSKTKALYFSFVTLATLGFGDIVPRTDVTRGLAIVEGVGGQLFLAVLVARLVSLYSRSAGE